LNEEEYSDQRTRYRYLGTKFMNLRARHLPIILLGAAIGAGIGRLLSSILPIGIFPGFEKAIGTAQTWVVIAALAGAALAVLIVLVHSVRDPNGEPPGKFTRINGTGSTLIGRNEIAEDGAFLTTEWFTVLFMPVFPVCGYRVTQRGHDSYIIHSKQPPRLRSVLKIYLAELTFAAIILLVLLLHSFVLGALVVVVMLALCVRWWISDRSAARKSGIIYSRNFCRACGYRLTGNTSGRCPECGKSTTA
jgi:hypothetical protein